MKLRLSDISLLSMFLVFGRQSGGAAAGDENWDSHFGVPGARGTAGQIAILGENVCFAGDFSSLAGSNATRLASWDGTNWAAIGLGVNGIVFSLFASGADLYAGGAFSTAGGVPASRAARWDSTSWSALGSGMSDIVRAFSATGSSLYAGGQFTSVGGTAALKIAKWDSQTWTAFGAITNFNPFCNDGCFDDAAVFALGAAADGLYVGGRFVSAGGVSANNFARWDGTNWWAVGGGGVDGQVRAVVAAAGSGVYVGGDFSHAGGVASPAIAFWDGTTWHALGAGLTKAIGPPSVLALSTIGTRLYVGGQFDTAGGSAANNIAVWDGSSWSPLGTGLSGGVASVASRGADLFVAGHFDTAGGKASTNIALWHIPHSLSIRRFNDSVTLSWPSTGTNFVLEAVDILGQTNWAAVPEPWSIVDDQCVVTNGIPAANRFYRLRRQ